MRMSHLFQGISATCLCAHAYAFTQKPVADFDGDHKTDISTFRCSDSTWYLQESSSGYQTFAFGECGDLAAVGDYDGDGKADLAIFRPSNGTWIY